MHPITEPRMIWSEGFSTDKTQSQAREPTTREVKRLTKPKEEEPISHSLSGGGVDEEIQREE